MPAFVEFLLIAALIYLSESALWLPLRSTALRKSRRRTWKAVPPGHFMATRETGLLPMLPLPPDGGLAPCQAPPAVPDGRGGFWVETQEEQFAPASAGDWADFQEEPKALVLGGVRVRLSSPRGLEPLKRAKSRGLDPASAILRVWRQALSPGQAALEWRRWRIAASPLRRLCPLLTLGFFAGLPLVYTLRGPLPALWLALWLWALMIFIACHVWWLGKRVYPAARTTIRMDAFLCAVVPFHAMRIMENLSVHAMATTHPMALILSTGDTGNPWLARFLRRLLFPRPECPGDLAWSAALRPLVEEILTRRGMSLASFDTRPGDGDDPESECYCPRCHGLFLAHAGQCQDCRGIALRPLDRAG